MILPSGCQLYFIIGVDAFLEIELWKSFQEVLQRVNFIISPRRGYAENKMNHLLDRLGYQRGESHWQRKSSLKVIHLLHSIPPDISSTMLRARIGQGESIDKLVPSAVRQYINSYKLYVTN